MNAHVFFNQRVPRYLTGRHVISAVLRDVSKLDKMRLKSHLNKDISPKSPVLFLILGVLGALGSLYAAWFHYTEPYGCDPYKKFCSFANWASSITGFSSNTVMASIDIAGVFLGVLIILDSAKRLRKEKGQIQCESRSQV